MPPPARAPGQDDANHTLRQPRDRRIFDAPDLNGEGQDWIRHHDDYGS
jgi:hypothetical protein